MISICMYVCMCVYMYVYIYIYTYVHVCIYIYIYDTGPDVAADAVDHRLLPLALETPGAPVGRCSTV